MERYSNSYELLVGGERIVLGWDDSDPDWVAITRNVTSPLPIRSSALGRSEQDGGVQGDGWLDARPVVFDATVTGSDPVTRLARLGKLNALLNHLREDVAICWTRDNGVDVQLVGRLETWSGINHDDGSPQKPIQLGFRCSDPYIRTQRVWSIEQPPGVSFAVENAGLADTRPDIYVFGPAETITLHWGAYQTQLELSTPLADGEYVVFSGEYATARRNGGRNISGALVDGYDAFPIIPADSAVTMSLNVSGGGPATKVRVDWTHNWLV